MPTEEELEWVSIASDADDPDHRLFKCLGCHANFRKTYAMHHFSTMHAGMGDHMLRQMRNWIVVPQGAQPESISSFFFAAMLFYARVERPR